MRIAQLIKNTKQALTIQPSYVKPMSAVEREQQNKRVVRFVCAVAVSLLALEPSIALAVQPTTDNLTTAASNILGLFTGTLGKAVATIAVVVMGFMAMFGKLEWDRAFKLILGIAIVFGAAAFVKLIAGTDVIGGIGP